VSEAALPVYLTGTAVTTVAAILLTFVAHLAVVSWVGYEADQQRLYAELRGELANATAPTGQGDPEALAEGDVALLAPGTPVAHLAIPAIGLETVVVEGTASGVTASGPGHRRDTVLPGQPGTSVIMGRKDTYGGPFSRLHELSTGDVITVVTGQGEHTYEVISRRLTGDPMPPVPDDPETGRLTLTTAAGRPFLPDDVLRVDAELVSDPVPAAPRLIAAGSLPASEEAMSGDPDAWTPVLLYAQGMALVSLAVAWARRSWGGVQAWTAGVPVLGFFGLSLADQVSRLLPNLL